MTTIVDMAALVADRPGFDLPSPRWHATLAYFYGLPLTAEDVETLTLATRRSAEAIRARAGKPFRELWCRIGRRGWKSSVAALIAVYEAVYGGHEAHLLPGERGLIAVVSKDIAGSTAVARLVELFAGALGITCTWTSMGSVRILVLEGYALAVACFPCSATAPRGYAIPVVITDEIAHWQTDSDEYSNADSSVLAAIKPAMAQFPGSRLVAISSPLGHEGVFHETVEENLGDTDGDVLAVEGATWLWNLGITEERTQDLEKDPDTHAREFGAVPSANEGTAFVPADVARCFETPPGNFIRRKPFIALDPAASGNTFAGVVACWCDPVATVEFKRKVAPPGSGVSTDVFIGWEYDANNERIPLPVATRPVLFVFEVFGWTGQELRETSMDKVAADIGAIGRSYGVDVAFSDEHGGPFLAALLAPHALRMSQIRQTAPSKHDAVTLLRTLMRDRQLCITAHAGMERDLRTYPRRVVGGGFRYGAARAGHHWDFASALIVLAHGLLGDEYEPIERHHQVEGNPALRFRGGRFIADGR